MTVDLEAIARRSGSELSSLKLALPLVEQGFAPPFLARYRRDELGGVSESALWMLQHSIRAEQSLDARREELHKLWERTRLADKSLEKAIRDAKSKPALGRVTRRLKSEPADPNIAIPAEVWVASRILNPEPGDTTDIAQIAQSVGQAEAVDKFADTLDRALARRLAEHPQMLGTAVRWLTANASIKFLDVSDPNIDTRGDDESPVGVASPESSNAERPGTEPGANWPSPEQLGVEPVVAQPAAEQPVATAPVAEQPVAEQPVAEQPVAEQPVAEQPVAEASAVAESVVDAEAASATPVLPGAEATAADEHAANSSADEGPVPSVTADGASTPGGPVIEASQTASLAAGQGKKKGKAKQVVKKTKVFKKLSPRQRRRRWLISILEPLVGKQIPIRDLSPFQTLVLSRALRGNLVRCQFVYDANQLIGQLQKTAAHLNPAMAERLSSVVGTQEASIREATEAVWWEELQDIASNRLVEITAAHLDEQLHRGGVEAKVVLAIDAVGPRTSPVAIVSSDGRLLHTEDIASQLENDLRTASVTRLGELIHRFGVDLIVVGNGPARRATMIILGELIAQSPAGSVRWTIAERSGADAYAGSDLADREMRTTPRRFRAATWLAFSLLKPAWALAKVNPLRLRLSAAQRELPDEMLAPALRDVMTSAISRGGLDVNAAAVDSLTQLPGVSRAVAEAIDRTRRQNLFTSREQLLALEEWPDEMSSRQAIGFLRVFGGEEPLDATVIHPEDYSLARKLAKSLNLELPPSAPPGYQSPSFDAPAESGRGVPVVAAVADSSAVAADDESPSSFAAELLAPETKDTDAASESSEAVPETDTPAPETTAPETTAPEPVAEASSGDETDQPMIESAEASAATSADETPSASAEPASETASPSAMFQPLPDPAAINKCIREWQVGSSRTHRLVHALCDPFGEEKLSNLGNPPAVMDRVPKPGDLRPGDEVVGVVASVAAFGAFVEISPEATGLIRVSRLAEEFVEEIHDYIQVGDIVTAWVTEVDQRRKLQLSAISPQREEELRARRQEMRENRNQRGSGPRRGQGGGSPREGQASGGQASGGQAARDGAPRRDGGAVGTAGRGRNDGGRPQSGQGGQGGRGEPRRGGRDDRRGGDHRGRDRGARREEPISYTTRVPKSQAPAPPISEAMAEGKEPLRSFGDLLQFFKKDTPTPPTEVKPGGQKPKPAKDAAKPTEESESQSAAGQAAETGGGHEAGAGDGQSDAAVATGDRLAGPTATNESQA